MVGGTDYKINAFKLRFLTDSVHAVYVSVIAGLDVVFVQYIYDFTTYKIAPNGREVEEGNDRLVGFAAQFNCLIEAHSQTNDFAIDNATVIDRSNSVLL